MKKARTIWAETCEIIKPDMTQISFESYIRPLVPLALMNGYLVLEVPSKSLMDTLMMFYERTIADCAHRAEEDVLGIKFTLPFERDKYLDPAEEEIVPALNPHYTFDKFIVGKSNEFACAAAQAVAANLAFAYNPLFLYGGVGLGKTHLMHAIGHAVIEKDPNARIIYVSSETFTNELIASIQENKNRQFRDKYRNVDLLMIDDIQFIAGKESTQEEFFHTFNALYNAHKQIVICSDRPPKELTQLEERLRSRFSWGIICDIQMPDVETRIAILRNRQKTAPVRVQDDVIQFIAEGVQSNVRELEGAFNRAVAYSKFKKQELNMQLVTEALKDVFPDIMPQVFTVEQIQQAVADYYRIDRSMLISKRKEQNIVLPRMIAMYLCRTMTDASLKTIGAETGNRDHTTVMNAYKVIQGRVESEPQFAATIEDIKKRLV